MFRAVPKLLMSIAVPTIVVLGIVPLFAQSPPSLDTLKHNLRQAASEQDSVIALQHIARHFINANPDSAYGYNQRALQLSRTLQYDTGTAQSLLLAVEIAMRTNRLDTALYNGRQALSIYTELSDSLGQLQTLRTLGKVYRGIGQLDSSYAYLDHAYHLSKELNNLSSRADILVSIGMLYSQQRRLAQSLDYYLQALRIYQELNVPPKIAAVQSYIGNILIEKENYQQALSYLKESLATTRTIDHTFGICTNLGKIGHCYQLMNQYDSALSYLLPSLSIAQEANFASAQANALSAIADVYRAQGDYQKAIDYGLQTLALTPPTSNAMRADRYYHLAEAYFSASEYTLAYDYLQSAVRMAEQARDVDILANSYQVLSRIDSIRGNFLAALDWYQQYVRTADSLVQRQEKTRFEELQTRYESEQKDQRIKRLQQQAQIQRLQAQQQRTQITAAVIGLLLLLGMLALLYSRYHLKRRSNQQKDQLIRDKELLMQEIHHRAKNHLHTVQHLLELQAQYLKDPQAMQAVLESRSRIHAVALIHQQLYQVSPTGRVNLQQHLHQLLQHIHSSHTSHKPIELETFIASINIDLSLAVPLGLIANEVITNAYKHAFDSQGGEIVVRCHFDTANNTLLFAVTDNGRGMPQLPKHRTTMGLRLVQGMARQLEADYSFDSNITGGTTFQLTLRSNLIYSTNELRDQITTSPTYRI